MSHHRGFTLIEVMLVVAILGILAAIAIPNFSEHLRKGRRADAMGALVNFSAAMERYYTQHNTYLGTAQGDAPSAPLATFFSDQAPIDGGDKNYDLTLHALGTNSFTLRATPVGVQQGDGYLELLSTGLKQWDRNNNGVIEADERCWEGRCS